MDKRNHSGPGKALTEGHTSLFDAIGDRTGQSEWVIDGVCPEVSWKGGAGGVRGLHDT
jgi:hypothetical protein